MAQQQLRCPCGWAFLVSDAALKSKGPVMCPSCGQPVGMTGPNFAGNTPRPQQRVLTAARPSKMPLIVAGAAGVLVLLVVVLVMSMSGGGGSSESQEEDTTRDARKRPAAAAAPSPYDVPVAPVRKDPEPDPIVKPLPLPSATAPAADVPKPAAAPAAEALPADLVKGVRERVLALPPYYQKLCLPEADRIRVERLLSAGKGDAQDAALLQGLLAGDMLKAVTEEAGTIADKASALEASALQELPMDRVLMNDGRALSGKIVDETPEIVKLERKISGGVGGALPLRRADIKAVEKGKGIGGEFKTRWEAAGKSKSAAELLALMKWCKENNLQAQAQLAAFRMLQGDPGHAAARAEAGLPADLVQRKAQVAEQGGTTLTYEGKSYTPVELRDKLVKDGLALIDGQFYLRRERLISIPGLFRYEKQTDKPVQISALGSTGLSYDKEIVFKSVQQAGTTTFVEQPEERLQRAFYAPVLSVTPPPPVSFQPGLTPYAANGLVHVMPIKDTPLPLAGAVVSGEVHISVPLGQPIVEASVMTLAEVAPGGSIEVYLGGSERVKAYTCGSKESGTRKLPDAIRGRISVDLVVVMSAKAAYTTKSEVRHLKPLKKDTQGKVQQYGFDVHHTRLTPQYQAMLFPSNEKTLEVFRVKAVVGEPATGVNNLFQSAGVADVLRR